MLIREATHADLPAILTIFNDVIATSTAVYLDNPVTLEDRIQWLEGRQAQGYPVLVAEEQGTVLGFASFGDFRAYHGYRYTVEHSVHLAEAARGKGIGSALVQALFPYAQALNKHVMIASIDAANEGSIRFHERLGFTSGAYLPQVGYKFGRWLDMVFMQRYIDGPDSPRQ